VKNALKKFLKARAHALKPVVITGQHGVTPAVLNEIDLALEHHELIKIRVNAADRDDRQVMIRQICEASSAELIQTIGHVVTLYRKIPASSKTIRIGEKSSRTRDHS
jgi:RNA-binding protein